MYTLLNNQDSSKFDLYLPGQLVASLHYSMEKDSNEVMFIYCEAVEKSQAEFHCQEIVTRALEDVLNRRMKISVSCPIALNILKDTAPPGTFTAIAS